MKNSLVDKVKDILERCPECGSSNYAYSIKIIGERRWKECRCERCGYNDSFEIQDESRPDCKLDETERKSDLAAIKDILTEKNEEGIRRT